MTTTAGYEQILFDRQGRVSVITLNRPEKLNAWTWKMAEEIYDAVRRCNDDRGIGAIVITGAGRGFCSGADIRGFNQAIEQRESAKTDEERRAAGGRPAEREPLTSFFRKAKPIIAAINGPAIGVGLTMTLSMDLRVASEQAKLSMRFVKVGIVPEAGSTLMLPQIVGIANALELSMTGRTIDGNEAFRLGLVNHVFPHDDLMPRTMELANEIAENPVDAVRDAKRMMHEHMVEQDVMQVVREEGRTITRAYSSADHKEAIRAFLEKRQPKFNQ